MSKLSNLTEVTTLNEDDLLYVVVSTNTAGNKSRGVSKSNLLSTINIDGGIIM